MCWKTMTLVGSKLLTARAKRISSSFICRGYKGRNTIVFSGTIPPWSRFAEIRYGSQCPGFGNFYLTQCTVRGLYDYKAQGSDELSITEGELVELSGGPRGGQNYADGWWEGTGHFTLYAIVCRNMCPGINTKGRKGIFPSNYVSRFFFSVLFSS